MARRRWLSIPAILLIVAFAASWGTQVAAQEPVTIQFWSTAWFPSSIAGRQQLVDKFNEEYQGRIQVEYVQGDWGQAETYVQSGAAAGGDIACVVEFEAEGAQNWYRKGWTLDLQPYLTEERRADDRSAVGGADVPGRRRDRRQCHRAVGAGDHPALQPGAPRGRGDRARDQ